MTWGVDFASVDGNKPPDFARFKAAGGSFAWVRGSFAYWNPGDRGWVLAHDPCMTRDWANIADAGLIRGAYMGPAIMASHSPNEQVTVFKAAVDAAGGLRPGIDFPPCLDVEFPGKGIADTGLDRAGVMAWIRTAVQVMRQAFSCWPIIYTSGRVWNDVDADCLGNPPAADLTPCPLWLARYAYKTRQPVVLPPVEFAPPVPNPWGDQYWAHQCQGDALGVPGFTATTDIDRFRVARQGDHGGHVAWYQRKRKLTADGAFGPLTKADVLAFQKANGLPLTGEIDARTFAAAAWLP